MFLFAAFKMYRKIWDMGCDKLRNQTPDVNAEGIPFLIPFLRLVNTNLTSLPTKTLVSSFSPLSYAGNRARITKTSASRDVPDRGEYLLHT